MSLYERDENLLRKTALSAEALMRLYWLPDPPLSERTNFYDLLAVAAIFRVASHLPDGQEIVGAVAAYAQNRFGMDAGKLFSDPMPG